MITWRTTKLSRIVRKLIVYGLSMFSVVSGQSLVAGETDHYVRINAVQDSEIGLMRMSDPFITRGTSRLEIDSSQGLVLQVENYTLPSYLNVRPRFGRTQLIDPFNGRPLDYRLPGEFSLAWRANRMAVTAGRRRLQTPFFQTDSSLLIPNLFESISLDFDINPAFQVSVLHVNAISDWGFGDEAITYQSIGNSFETRDTQGATAFSASFALKGVSVESWFYHMPDIQDIGYLQLGYRENLSDSVALKLEGQIDRVQTNGAALLGDIQSSTVGFRAELDWTNISLFASYNRLLSGSTAAIGIGGDPYFSSLQYRSFTDLNSEQSEGFVAGISYSAQSVPLEFDVAVARYRGGQREYDVSELDFSMGYRFSNSSKLGVFLSRIDDRIGDDDDLHLAIGLDLSF